jgi:hypothetical protein
MCRAFAPDGMAHHDLDIVTNILQAHECPKMVPLHSKRDMFLVCERRGAANLYIPFMEFIDNHGCHGSVARNQQLVSPPYMCVCWV